MAYHLPSIIGVQPKRHLQQQYQIWLKLKRLILKYTNVCEIVIVLGFEHPAFYMYIYILKKAYSNWTIHQQCKTKHKK